MSALHPLQAGLAAREVRGARRELRNSGAFLQKPLDEGKLLFYVLQTQLVTLNLIKLCL